MYAKKERGIISGLAAGSLHEWLFILEQSNKYSRILFKLIVLKFESLGLKGGGGGGCRVQVKILKQEGCLDNWFFYFCY